MNDSKTEKLLKTIRTVSIILGFAALLTAILAHFLPILNIQLDNVQSDYTFDSAGGHNFVGWQCIYYWWGPSIFIGGVSAFNFNPVLCAGILLPLFSLLICTPQLFKALYKKKAVMEFITAAAMVFGAIVFLNATTLAESSVGNHLAQYMKMAKDQGTYTLGWFVYILAAVFFVAAAVKVVSGVLSLKHEEQAEAERKAREAAEDDEDE